PYRKLDLTLTLKYCVVVVATSMKSSDVIGIVPDNPLRKLIDAEGETTKLAVTVRVATGLVCASLFLKFSVLRRKVRAKVYVPDESDDPLKAIL
ncbi:MAG: hypothetical protein QHH01_06805, partial [Spirochaetales bacterium]|nr:hypothetical protein [Spirochaetales bacterium]